MYQPSRPAKQTRYDSILRGAQKPATSCFAGQGDYCCGSIAKEGFKLDSVLPYSIQQAIKRTDNDKY